MSIQKKRNQKQCLHCKTEPSYNFEGSSPSVCGKHKEKGMINTKEKLCNTKGCYKKPIFNFKGLKGVKCSKHREKGMIDVKHPTCRAKNCEKRANYGFKYKSPEVCFTHKEKNMVSKSCKICEDHDCLRYALYNIKELKPKYCSKHKTKDMVDVKSKKCEFEGCGIQASYNIKGKKSGKYCESHKIEGMINVRALFCEFCSISASYGYEQDRTKLRCVEHADPDMINLCHPHCCAKNCGNLAYYGDINDKKVEYCFDHKKENMIAIHSKMCKTHMCGVRVGNDKYDGFCLRCFIHLFPDKSVAWNWKTKERAVVDYVLSYFPIEKYSWVLDKKIEDGCSLRRPDMILHLGDYVLIIEVDEGQHGGYDDVCEHRRMMEIYKDIQFCNTIFVRFNPDGFVKNNQKTPSCWTINKYGVAVVKHEEAWRQRLEKLKETVDYYLDPSNKHDKAITTTLLYFDEE